MDSGLDGLDSHSETQGVSALIRQLVEHHRTNGGLSLPSRQSLNMSSFSLYRLMLIGLLPSTVTLRFRRYFSSSLYGCLAPVLLKSKVMNKTGPSISDSLGTGVGLSVAGPIAGAVFSLVREGGVVASGFGSLFALVDFKCSPTWGSKSNGDSEDCMAVCLFSFEYSIRSVVVAGTGAGIFPDPALVTPCWPSSLASADVGKGPNMDLAGTSSAVCWSTWALSIGSEVGNVD